MENTLRLTEAQKSALECSGLELDETPSLVARCWQGSKFTFNNADRDALFTELTEMSNSEDETHENDSDSERRKSAGVAARSLGALASRVLKMKGN